MKKTLSIFLVAIALIVGNSSCKKDKTTPIPIDLGPNQVKSNVFVVDTTKWILRSNADEIAGGIYRFALTHSTPYVEIPVGSIIIGTAGDGYMRKVTSVGVNPYDMVIRTVQADFTDVFKMGTYTFQTDMNDMKPGISSTGFSHSFTNKSIFKDGDRSVTILNGHVDMNPTWNFTFGFDSLIGINKFEMATKNADFHADFTINATSPTQLSLGEREYPVASFSKKSIRWLPVGKDSIPVVVVTNVDLVVSVISVWCNLTLGQGGTANVSVSDQLGLGLSYNNGSWSDIYNANPTRTLHIDSISGRQNEWIHVALTPRVSMKICGKQCPVVSMAPEESLYKYLEIGATFYGKWDLSAYSWLSTKVGVTSTEILGKNIPLFSQQRSTDSISYYTPFLAAIGSGDGQTGSVSQTLANPVSVKVTDSYGVPQKEIPVYFNVMTGGGNCPVQKVFTDANGEAKSTWTLGPFPGPQTISAGVFKGNSQLISGAPVTFTATAQ